MIFLYLTNSSSGILNSLFLGKFFELNGLIFAPLVLAFKREDKIVVHRIYKIYTSGNEIFFKTKGDHNNAPDGYLTEAKEILGTVKFNIRYIGYPTVALYEKINR